ncbi:MAG: XdhC family protein [Lewinellaceae bacterium]|nr:XdhC family protein [Lewinellaceae bacterium]
MNFWQTLLRELENGRRVVLLYVLESSGSSPGRQGFKMLVSSSGFMAGSIGGGIMEFKLVEYCKAELLHKPFAPFFKKQIHRRDIPSHRSGMICSGEQTIAFYPLDDGMLPVIRAIVEKNAGSLTLDQTGVFYRLEKQGVEKYSFSIENDRNWSFTESLGLGPQLCIAGAGHVSLALCRMAAQLDFSVQVLDDRDALNTAPPPELATHTLLADFSQIGACIPEGENTYVVLLSFGYRTDKLILQQLLGRHYRYLGMMGSAEKVKTLFAELEAEGYSREHLQRVYAPIGLPINSRTPAEIAVSILAEVIKAKNSAF